MHLIVLCIGNRRACLIKVMLKWFQYSIAPNVLHPYSKISQTIKNEFKSIFLDIGPKDRFAYHFKVSYNILTLTILLLIKIWLRNIQGSD